MSTENRVPDATQLCPPEGLCRLPPFRPVALKLMRLVAREDVEFAEVASLLASDPGFSAEVLALANSPLYCTLSRITSLTRAIVVLGLDRTRSLAMTVAMQAFVSNVQMTRNMEKSWRHSMACALIAEELAPMYGLSRDQGYTAGLMHDLGRLGLLKAYPGPYAVLLTSVYDDAAQILRAERRLFDVDHCQAGLWLTRSWNFPEEFWGITANHHGGRLGREQGIVGLTGAACLLADALGFYCVQYHRATTMEDVVCELPASDELDEEQLRERIRERLQSVDLMQ
jgi:putative nucleotidyltransferase with HDIG domain